MRAAAVLCALVFFGCTVPDPQSADSGTDVGSDAGGGGAGGGGGGNPWKPSGDAGLIWADGIEPGDASACEAPSGKRCWWVDAQAADGGDGSYASPYNSFERLGGYVDSVQQGFVVGQVAGGDYIYVRGTFRGDLNVEMGKKTTLHLGRAQQGGTAAAPTVIKSWRGQPRAIFDGNHLQDDLIGISNATHVRIQNVELARSAGRGLEIGDGVEGAELASIYIHDGIGNGNSGVGGGALLRFTDNGQHEYVVRNCVFRNNKVQQAGPEGNIGALSVLGEPMRTDPGRIRIFNNIFEDEVTAIRQKHTAHYVIEGYGNVIRRAGTAFHVRSTNNDFHHNVVIDTAVAVAHDAWNYNIPTMTGRIRHNTFFNVASLLEVSLEYPTSPGLQVVRTFQFTDNILMNAGTQTAAMIQFGDSNEGTLTSNTTIQLAHNTFWYAPQTLRFVSMPTQSPSTRDFAWALANYAGTGSAFADPMFTDAANEDFSLLPGSPAEASASDGGNRGAR